MFGNALFNPTVTPSPRRHSHFDVSIAPKVSQRRSTMPYIDVAGMSPALGSMMGGYNERPHTPCFVTPTLGGFGGIRFSYDSPLQTLQAFSSGGLPTVNKKAAKRAWAKMKTKKWSKPCKITAILLLVSFSVTLFLVRKMKESSVTPRQASCNDETETCEAWEAPHHHENNPKENFMELVSQNDHYHSVEEEPSNLWGNRWGTQDEEIIYTSQSLDTPTEPEVNIVEEEPSNLWNNRWGAQEEEIIYTSQSLDTPTEPEVNIVEEEPSNLWNNRWGAQEEEISDTSQALDTPNESEVNVVEEEPLSIEDLPLISPSVSEQELPMQQTQMMPEMQIQSSSIPSEAPLQKNHVHVLDGVTSYHGNNHHHAVFGAPEPMQAPVKPALINPAYQQLLSGAMHQPGLPQPPTGQLPVPTSGVPLMNGMPAQLSGHLGPQQGYGVPPAPGIPQHHGHPAQGIPQHNGHPAQGMPLQNFGHPAPGIPLQNLGHPASGMPQHPAPGMPQHPAPGMPQNLGYPAPGMPLQNHGHGHPAPGMPQHPAPGMPLQNLGHPAPGMPLQNHGHPAPGMPQQHPAPDMPQQNLGHPAPGMPLQNLGHPAPLQNYGHPAPVMPLHHGQQAPGLLDQFYGQQAPVLMPQPVHQVAPGINPARYNQPPQQPQYHHNQGGIIGLNPPHHNAYQNNGQKLPPGVNPQRYMEL